MGGWLGLTPPLPSCRAFDALERFAGPDMEAAPVPAANSRDLNGLACFAHEGVWRTIQVGGGGGGACRGLRGTAALDISLGAGLSLYEPLLSDTAHTPSPQ